MNSAKNLQTPEARAKAAPRIAESLRGRKQSEELVARRVATWKKTAEQHGGMTPAHREQLAHIQNEYRGEVHHNWNGGTTRKRLKEWQSMEYKAFRRTVANRDGWTCRHCGIYDRKIEIHHILPYAQCQGPLEFLKYEPSNGIALCHGCHKETQKAPRPDLQQPAFSQLPHDVVELIRREIGPEFQA